MIKLFLFKIICFFVFKPIKLSTSFCNNLIIKIYILYLRIKLQLNLILNMLNHLRIFIEKIRYSINEQLDKPLTFRQQKYLLNIVGILVTTSLMIVFTQDKLIKFFSC